MPFSINWRVDNLIGVERALSTLTGAAGNHQQFLPDTTVLRVFNRAGEPTWLFTLLANRGYDAHNRTLLQSLARAPFTDTMSVARGVVGNYPQLFIDVPLGKVREFVENLRPVYDITTWRRFLTRYSEVDDPKEIRVIKRQSADFWPFVDWLHAWNLNHNGPDAGVLDLSAYFWHESVR